MISAVVNAIPIRHLTPAGMPRIPTPTETAKTSRPNDIATKTTLKKAATLTRRFADSA